MAAGTNMLLEAARARISLCPHWGKGSCVGQGCPEIDLCDAVRIIEAAGDSETPDEKIVLKTRVWYEAQKRFEASMKAEKKTGSKRSEATTTLWDEAGARMKELIGVLEG